MGAIFPGRYLARSSEPFVLFRIGMRFNGLRGLGAALRTFTIMPLMLAEQPAKPEIGMLSTSISLSWPVIQITQFWRSFDDLERYATSPTREHTKAWRWFNKLGRAVYRKLKVYRGDLHPHAAQQPANVSLAS